MGCDMTTRRGSLLSNEFLKRRCFGNGKRRFGAGRGEIRLPLPGHSVAVLRVLRGLRGEICRCTEETIFLLMLHGVLMAQQNAVRVR